jgi:hypothetical protein
MHILRPGSRKWRGSVCVIFWALNIRTNLHFLKEMYTQHVLCKPIIVAARSKAWTVVFARSKASIVGLNPIQGMDVCLR